MILQALNDYYQRSGELAKEGWMRRGVDYLFVLDPKGNCVNIEAIHELKKGKTIQHQMLVPAIGKQALKHTNSGKDANLLWDNASFSIGTGGKGKQKLECFVSELKQWFSDCNDDGVKAVLAFCEGLLANPDSRAALIERHGLKDLFDERDYVIAFKLLNDVEPVHARPQVREAYERKRVMGSDDKVILGNCLVTGAVGVPITINETVLKGVWGGQSAGVNLISFNKRSFESYGKKERAGENAPVSRSASFGYTTALNHLLASDRQRMQVGDASTVFWARAQHEMEDLFGEVLKDDPERGTDALKALYKAVSTGRFAIGDPDAEFYVLGLAAPSNSRVAIRFFESAPARVLAERITQHFTDLTVSKETAHFSILRLLTAIAVRGERENIPANLASDFLRAVVEGRPYPTILLNLTVQRCRAEQANRDKKTGGQNVTRERAAIIKACLNRTIRRTNQTAPNPEPEYTAMLDPNNPDNAYRMGRLFAALERTQEDASPGLNATIRDRYYGAASSTPATVFSTLLRLKNHHVAKLHPGQAVNREKLIGEIMDGLDRFPGHLPLPAQARFALGYYHQRQDFFKKKETTPEPSNN